MAKKPETNEKAGKTFAHTEIIAIFAHTQHKRGAWAFALAEIIPITPDSDNAGVGTAERTTYDGGVEGNATRRKSQDTSLLYIRKAIAGMTVVGCVSAFPQDHIRGGTYL